MRGLEGLRRRLPERFEPLLSGAQFGRFVSVGVLGAIADTAVLAGTVLLVGLPEFWAKAAGIEVAVVVLFLANERWTFTEQGRAGWVAFLTRLWRSHLVRTGGVGVQLAVFWALIVPYRIEFAVAGVDLWVLVASLVSIAVATALNYVLESLFTWQIQADEPPRNATMESDDRV